MSVDLRLRHDRLLREQAVELFERGIGYGLTAKRLGVPAEAVRDWQKTYRAIGKDGLLAMGGQQARYDYETKVAAARAVSSSAAGPEATETGSPRSPPSRSAMSRGTWASSGTE